MDVLVLVNLYVYLIILFCTCAFTLYCFIVRENLETTYLVKKYVNGFFVEIALIFLRNLKILNSPFGNL